MINRKGLEFTFSWIFAIIAGTVILFSAIYITTKLIGSNEIERNTFVASELSNILSPIETNLEDSKYSLIEFTDETRVYNECSNLGVFGKQQLSTSSKKSGSNGWSEQSIRKSSFNKYIFSRKVEDTDGTKMHVLASPLTMPFKIGDILIMHGRNYCFVNPSSAIEEKFNELSSNGMQDIGVNITNNIDSCPRNSTKVCFNQIGCDVNVNTLANVVTKSGKNLYYYGDSLQLAAIFSDTEIYECQIKRLASRAGELGSLYARKALYIEGSGCNNNLVSDLQSFVLRTNVSNSADFRYNKWFLCL